MSHHRALAERNAGLSDRACVIVDDITTPLSLEELVADYVRLRLEPNIRTWEGSAATLRQKAMHGLLQMPANAVTKRNVLDVLDGVVAAGKPHAANNLLKNLRACFNWAIGRDLLTVNPCDRVQAPIRTTQRDRILNNAEIVEIWNAAGKLQQPYSAMIRMLLLTGQRRCEVSNMAWEEIEADAWVIPRERVKKDRPHTVPLTTEALQVLNSVRIKAEPTGYVFSTDGGRRPSSNFNKIKKRLDELSGVKGWVLHDLRRTVRSKLAELGVPRDVARKIVNHQEAGIDRVYQRYEYLNEKRTALTVWHMHLKQLIGEPFGLLPDNNGLLTVSSEQQETIREHRRTVDEGAPSRE